MRLIPDIIKDSIELKNKVLNDSLLLHKIENIVEVCVESLQNGNSIWWCGNGGSAADAQHLAAELSGRFYFDRPPLASEALHVNSSYLTAVANDYSYDVIYSRYLEGCGKKGDVLIGISTSGGSTNVTNAFKTAQKKGIHTMGLTGSQLKGIADYSDIILNIPSTDTPRIQECHIMVGHIICEQIENKIYKYN